MNNQLLDFIQRSPSCFHAVENMKQELVENGYQELIEQEKWSLQKGGKYFVTRNGSSIIAFHVGKNVEQIQYQITSSHSDSPTFKVKENGDLCVANYAKLNTEMYGGLIASTFFDRPLSLAGRVMIKSETGIRGCLVNIDKDILMIPNVAIHMNREINKGYTYNLQVDTLPMIALGEFELHEYIASYMGIAKEDIIAKDLYVYNRQLPCVWGANDDFVSAPKLDDLQCAYASFKALMDSENDKVVNMSACFDNEEVGSSSKQGAGSTFLYDVLQRIHENFGESNEHYVRSISKSFMISCDNAHAVHPNHPQKSDETNRVYLNKGIVVKHNANQKYTTDAISNAVFKQICEKANVSIQHFANRSDMVGGSTLGNVSSTKVSMHCIDIGLPQLAMHSAYESAGSKDTQSLYDALIQFHNCTICIKNDHIIDII